ncbi:hypothetical protein BJ508DRAFT_415470 [Ascobolus immersus RN42]|uniref:Phosphatidate phosphatase APP1 catalytic domain-containing protein n=1 Tax=Ascobolus immersus RN42 TaxID=1160509 RepID=A0A3N4I4B0_ASCIM|nr:hypothetical protein BJ508DRAFT_415470 [Ascobolus immersus RN42]
MAPLQALAFGALALTSSLVQAAPDLPPALDKRQNLNDLSSLIQDFPKSIQDSINNGIFSDIFTNVPDDARKARDMVGNGAQMSELEILTLPAYANYTNNRWNAYIHGQAYTRPLDPSNEQIQRILPSGQLSQIQRNDMLTNFTSHLLLLPQEGVTITLNFKQTGGQGNGGEQSVTLPRKSDSRGEFNEWVQLPGNGWPAAGNGGGPVAKVDVTTEGSDVGNSTVYLVPEEGMTIVSDIDDILRVTKIWDPPEGILNTFARPYEPWMNMPDVYAAWEKQSAQGTAQGSASSTSVTGPYHFHYLTTTPEQASRFYMSFIYANYPLGSFTTRPLNFSNIAETLSPRETALRRIFQTFPKRKFVLVGDTTNNDAVSNYPKMAQEFPGSVHCILIRNVSATEPDNIIPYNTQPYERLKRESYMFFNTPDDLMGINFQQGECRNNSVRDNVEFGWQGGPGGTWRDWIRQAQNGGESLASRSVVGWSALCAGVAGLALMWL